MGVQIIHFHRCFDDINMCHGKTAQAAAEAKKAAAAAKASRAAIYFHRF